MGISSLGVGSGILTQDVIDQLRAVDDAQRIRPITLNIANENDKKNALKIIDASMTNFIDSINEIKTASLWNERSVSITSGSSVSASVIANTDVQDFSLNVTALATKQIEQSGSFTAKTDAIDGSGLAGSFDIQVGIGDAISIDYDAGASLDDMRKLINEQAGDLVDATIVQISSGDFRLFLSAKETGASADISISGTGLDSRLKDSVDGIGDGQATGGLGYLDLGDGETSAGKNASFTFNGQEISRESNTVDDLITGLTLELKSEGISEVSIAQDRSAMLSKFDSFVSKYNAAMVELDKVTKVSVESDERGIFSNDSTVKSMKRAIGDMIESVGGSVGSLLDYGFDVDKDGKMTLDKTILEGKMDENPKNVQAFFAGGDFTNELGTSTAVTGAFVEIATIIEGYTKTNQTLDLLKDALSDNISNYEDRKESATERLDAKYEIMKKQFSAYDAMISRFNASSSIFTQLINADSSS